MKQLLLLLVIGLAVPSEALAQGTSTQTVKLPVARRLYDEGVDAADKGQWSIAHDRFKASYELVPRMHTLFNLACAQSQTGRLVEATENYRKFLRDANTGSHADLRAQATSQLELIERQLAHLTIDVGNLDSGDTIAVDEVELPPAVLHQSIPMNPGPHVARIQRGSQVIASRAITLASGAAESVRIELPARPVILDVPPRAPSVMSGPPAQPRPSPPPPQPAERSPGRSWLRSPWLWSGVAVVVGGSAAGAYLLTRRDGVVIH
jgi:hypothetical protein